LRARIKSLVEPALGWAGRRALRSPGASRHAVILAYHNIVPDGLPHAGDRPLHLSVSSFARQLDLLAECCEVVPLPAALESSAPGRLRVAITFDDAYRGAVTLGRAELGRLGLPATMFVPPGLLGGATFWWDDLAGAEGLSPALRARALDERMGKDAEVRRLMPPAAAVLPPELHSASAEDLDAAARQPGFTLGSHTWSHPNLARLDTPELGEELIRPLHWLGQRFSAATIPWLSYPYGLFSAPVVAATRRAGYAGALLVAGGRLIPNEVDRFAIPRINVPSGLSLNGLALRLAGLRP